MKRLPKLSGLFCTILLALGALAFMVATPRTALGQAHGVSIHKSCVTPKIVGETNDCTITLSNADGFNDNWQVNSSSDLVEASGGNVTESNLPINAASGNTTCVIAGSLPCLVGPACDGTTITCLSGVTAPAAAGSVSFRDNKYTIVSGDAPTLNDQGTVNAQDTCNKGASGCSTSSVPENSTAATDVQTCGVTIDKQISCDGGTTWTNATTASTGVVTGTCTGFTGDPIQVRYVYQNTGSTNLTSCNIHDVTGQTAETTGGTAFTLDTSVGSLSSGGSAITSSVITTSDGSTLLTCNAAGPNYDTANIDCVCGTSTIHAGANDTAHFSCESCSVQIDKQVSCAGGSYVDVFGTDDTAGASAGTTLDSCTGYDAYTGHTADNIAVQYVIKNTGDDGLNTCSTGETNSAITGSATIPGTPATLTSSQTTTLGPFNNACSPALILHEGTGGDTANIGCTCDSLTNNTTVKNVGFQDTAGFNCLAPGLNVSKTCAPQSGGVNAVTVTATNTSTDTALTSCVATDTYNTNGDCSSTTSPVPPLTNSLPLSPSGSVDLGLSGSGTETATWNANLNGLTADACNSGSVTCNIGTTSNTITVYNDATCPVNQGCETRTPGFWKTHPNITSDVMTTAGGFIQSCGLDLNNVLAGTDCSAIEDMCSLGNDAAKLGIDPTQANLIFQCAAAELNLAVTTQDGGSCGATIPNSSYTFDQCCGLAGACATANPATLYGCQQAVSAFNAQYDTTTLTSGSVLNNPGADPTACQAANGNGFVNDQSAIGATSPVADCSATGRLYLTKATGNNNSSTNNGQHKGQNK